jgi:hypothetical protein
MAENPDTIGNILMNVDGNSLKALMRIHWEQGAQKIPPFQKEKNRTCTLRLSIGSMQLLFAKLFVTIFRLD